MWTHVKKLAPFWMGALGVLVAGAAFLIGLHVWTDHQALHQVIGFLNTNAAKINAIPTGK